ncbi:hypothetical protein WICPIJ_006788 [Wickerhamomyces pijperi]|uniref:Uncharacterized protein n=1 Tax=Wickerhamomyces pijperi TaxID=599730 RepID=A0A9P8TKM6_WICPI|nr:hypothetical protein WICPIJ_006788 [Wickerhamomyces pijperi]
MADTGRSDTKDPLLMKSCNWEEDDDGVRIKLFSLMIIGSGIGVDEFLVIGRDTACNDSADDEGSPVWSSGIWFSDS